MGKHPLDDEMGLAGIGWPEYGGDTAMLGVQATSSFLLWATAASACGAELTRACVLDNLEGTPPGRATDCTPDFFGEEFMTGLTQGVEQDFPISANKVHRARPVLCEADTYLPEYRKWARQFYSQPVG